MTKSEGKTRTWCDREGKPQPWDHEKLVWEGRRGPALSSTEQENTQVDPLLHEGRPCCELSC